MWIIYWIFLPFLWVVDVDCDVMESDQPRIILVPSLLGPSAQTRKIPFILIRLVDNLLMSRLGRIGLSLTTCFSFTPRLLLPAPHLEAI